MATNVVWFAPLLQRKRVGEYYTLSCDPVKAEVVKHRFFVGTTNSEVAKVMNLSEATARRHWEHARAWLFAEIKKMTSE